MVHEQSFDQRLRPFMLYRWIDCLGLRREEIPAENVCSTGNDMSRAVPWCFGEAVPGLLGECMQFFLRTEEELV